jgi:drug/metabolite transporter (DMT)-like permease
VTETPKRNSSPASISRGDLALLGLTTFWGSTFPVVRATLRDISPHAFLVARFTLGALVAALIARRQLAHRPSLRAGVVLGVLLYAGFAFQTIGLRFTTSTRSAFLTAMSVLLVPLIAFLLFRRTFHPANYLGVLVASVGLVVLTSPFSDHKSGLLLGDALTLGCSLTFAFHIVLADRWSPGIHPTATTAVQTGVAALLALGALPFETLSWHPHAESLAAIVYTGIVGSTAALSIQLWGQARTTAIRAALIFTLEPVFATLFASIFAGDRTTSNEIAGGCLVVLGVAIGQIGPAWFSSRRQVIAPPS